MQTIVLPNGLEVACLNTLNTLDLYAEIFTHRVYGRTGVEIEDNDLIFDVGANIGLFSLWARSRNKTCRLRCFEPSADTYAALRYNVVGASCIRAAVSDHCGTVSLTHYPRLPELSTIRPGDFKKEEKADWIRYLRRRIDGGFFLRWLPGLVKGWLAELARTWLFRSEVTVVPCLTLEAALKGLEPGDTVGLLKVDVEKSELLVLQGIGNGWDRIRQIIVESYGDEKLVKEIDDLLKSKGFMTTWHDNPMFPELRTPLVFARRPALQCGGGPGKDSRV